MAKCEICGKDVAFGIKVSHSHRRSNRTWKPNIKRVRAVVNGSNKRNENKREALRLLFLLSFRNKNIQC